MQVDESSPNSSFGNPQFIQNGETIYGLHVDSKQLPSLNSLLGRYAWVETGIESPCGPQLNEGMNLKLENPGGQLVQGELTILGQVGVITAVRRSDSKGGEDDAPCWEFDLTWNVLDENQDPSFPAKASVYVGTVLDDNNAPFLEVVFRDEKDVRSPYGYAKRQANEGDAVGLSDAEKERLNFLTIADYDAVMDTKEAKQRKRLDKLVLKKRLEEEERQKREEERKKAVEEQKEKRKKERSALKAAEKILQANQEEAGQKPREQQVGMTRKQRRAANRKLREGQQAASGERKNAQGRKPVDEDRTVTSQRTGKDLVGKQESLIREEGRFDLLKNLPSTASSSRTQAPATQTPTMLPTQRWQWLASLNPIAKQEETAPSLRPAGHHGTKRSHPDDPEDKDFKRVKLEY